MSFLSVGGTVIPVAPGSGNWDWNDAIDRRRSFDNTYRASATGGAARDGRWSTPPVSKANAAIYRAVLQKVDAQLCIGDMIEIPTMCCAELIGEAPVKSATPTAHLVTLSFGLHEVQPKKLLLKYSPGDTITGESFTRSTTAFQVNASGVLVSKAINVKRDGHYVGAVGPGILLEDARTNLILRSQELNNAAWTATASVTGDTTTAPDGTGTAETVNDSSGAATQDVHQGITVGNNTASYAASIFLKANTSSIVGVSLIFSGGTGLNYGIVVNLATGATLTQSGAVAPSLVQVTALGSGWYRVAITGANNGLGNTTLSLFCYPAWNSSLLAAFSNAATGSVSAWGGQVEADATFASSYIPTTTVAATRGADSYSLPFTTPPQEMTVYAKRVELGTEIGIATTGVYNLGGAAPNLVLYRPGSNGLVSAFNAGAPSGPIGTTAAIGDVAETIQRLYGDGSTGSTKTLNSGSESAEATTAVATIPSAWAALLFYPNGDGAYLNRGFGAFQSFKIVAGARSLSDMRAA